MNSKDIERKVDADSVSTSGKLTPKPSDNLRKKLAKRAKDQMQLVQAMNADGKVDTFGVLHKPSPSEKRSKAWRKKMRTKDEYKIPYDFQEPEPVKGDI